MSFEKRIDRLAKDNSSKITSKITWLVFMRFGSQFCFDFRPVTDHRWPLLPPLLGLRQGMISSDHLGQRNWRPGIVKPSEAVKRSTNGWSNKDVTCKTSPTKHGDLIMGFGGYTSVPHCQNLRAACQMSSNHIVVLSQCIASENRMEHPKKNTSISLQFETWIYWKWLFVHLYPFV